MTSSEPTVSRIPFHIHALNWSGVETLYDLTGTRIRNAGNVQQPTADGLLFNDGIERRQGANCQLLTRPYRDIGQRGPQSTSRLGAISTTRRRRRLRAPSCSIITTCLRTTNDKANQNDDRPAGSRHIGADWQSVGMTSALAISGRPDFAFPSAHGPTRQGRPPNSDTDKISQTP